MKRLLVNRRTIVAAILLLCTYAVNASGQEISTDASNPTRLEAGTISGKLMPQKNKKYYVTFLAGPGDIFFDVTISPKENKGALFFWNVYRSVEDTIKDNVWCPDHLYLETEAKGRKCVVTSGDNKTRQVVLGFGAYSNSDPVKITYTIKLSGDWKQIPSGNVSPNSALDLSTRQALYIDTFQQDKVDTKAKYATPGSPVTVFRSDNVNCDKDACGFQLGFFLFRNSSAGALTTNIKITNGEASKTELVTFEPGKRVADVVVHLPIYNGNNKVVVEVNPQKQQPESTEKNNRFEVTVILKP